MNVKNRRSSAVTPQSRRLALMYSLRCEEPQIRQAVGRRIWRPTDGLATRSELARREERKYGIEEALRSAKYAHLSGTRYFLKRLRRSHSGDHPTVKSSGTSMRSDLNFIIVL